MSELCAYKLEDIAWDELGDDNHHIVPHIGTKRKGYSSESDINKKQRYELSNSDNTLNYNNATNNGVHTKEGTNLTSVPMREHGTMLEKGPCRYQSKGPFSSRDDDRTTSNQCISSNMNSICSDSCVDDVDNNNLFYQLNNANQNDVDLLDNNLQDKESNDLLYYGWPEIENFDEVDRMFRSCDSTFGLNIDNDDELGWFSSSREIEGSNDVLKSSFDLSGFDQCAVNNASRYQNIHGLNDTSMLKNESGHRFTPVDLKGSSQELNPNSPLVVVNGSGTDNYVDSNLQMQSCVSHLEQQKSSEDERKEASSDNGGSSFQSGNLKQVGESTQSHEQLKLIAKSNNDFQYVPLSMPNETQCVDISFQNPIVSSNKKKDRLHQHKSRGHAEKRKLIQKSESDKEISSVENDIEGISEVNGSDPSILGDIDTCNIQESSCLSSVMDEVSIEASSFRQLQQVMEQLDVRTKLCIRDSLYRLARSAEQRHKCVSQTGGGRNNKDASGPLISDETDKCSGFVDIETETNPIDRSIAHLLFHRPSDPSATAARDAMPTKSYQMIQAPQIGKVMVDKPICEEETTPTTNEAIEE